MNLYDQRTKAKIVVYWIRNKTRDFATRQCSVIHCKGTRDTIYTMEWEMILLHMYVFSKPRSCHYCFFQSLQLSGKHFNSKEYIRKCIDDFISSKQLLFFRKGIHNLFTRWEKINTLRCNLVSDLCNKNLKFEKKGEKIYLYS